MPQFLRCMQNHEKRLTFDQILDESIIQLLMDLQVRVQLQVI